MCQNHIFLLFLAHLKGIKNGYGENNHRKGKGKRNT